MSVDDDYIALVEEVLIVTSEASEQLLREHLAAIDEGGEGLLAWGRANTPERKAALDKRRAEIWREHLDKAGLTIGRK